MKRSEINAIMRDAFSFLKRMAHATIHILDGPQIGCGGA